jgi:3-methyladenine DNA glycosylase AlkD
MSTFHFVKRGDFSDTSEVAELLLHDREDLIHKAVGWMLREVGKRNGEAEKGFLSLHYRKMPRIMLRYAIEKLPETERLAYLRGTN